MKLKLHILLGCLLSARLMANDMSFVSGGTLQPFFKDEKEVGFLTKRVPAFWIEKLPVTNENFRNFVNSNLEWKKSKAPSLFVDKNYLAHWNGDISFPLTAKNSPVVNVSWFAAQAFCHWQGKRLATTDEWETVAQASESSKDASRDQKFLDKILNWYAQPTPRVLPSVGKASKNIYNVSDLHGLVWEWVYDFNSLMLTEDSRDEKGPSQKFYCGSGAYNSKDNRDYAAFMRYGFRSSLKANYTVANLGFRCAKGSDEKIPLAQSPNFSWPRDSLYNLPIEFQDQEGAELKLKALQGSVQILSMVYTGCSSVCPLTVQILKKIASQFLDTKKIHFILVSFDTEKDTPEVLKSFAQKHHLEPGQFTLLHGSPESIRTLAAALNLNYKQNTKGDFYHSNNISVIDTSGVLRFQEKGLSDIEGLTKEIRSLTK